MLRIENWKLKLATLAILATFSSTLSALAQTTATPTLSTFQPFNLSTGSYTNHAGNTVSGVIVALDARTATFSNAEETVTLPLSIFPESEQRRLAADFGTPRIPEPVLRAVAGAERAIARSRQRAEKGLCTHEESNAFCAKSAAVLKNYLDNQLELGTITSAERKALGW